MQRFSQSFILGPILLLLNINDIVEDINSCMRLLSDGTILYIIANNPVNATELNSDLL